MSNNHNLIGLDS